MDPRRVLTFRAVAEQRSFSRAAEALALTQPSVSQQVAALEAEVGTRLIDRRPGGLTLTRAGEVLLEHADVVAQRLALARDQLAELVADERATLRLGAFPSAIGSLVPVAMAELPAGTRVTVDELRTDDLPEAVRSGAVHLGVTFQDAAAPRRQPDGLERVDLMAEPFVAALGPSHPLADAPAVRLADLADDAWTAPSPDGIVVQACRDAGFEPRLTSLLRDQSAIRGIVGGGHAVTLVSSLARDALPGVVTRPLDPPGPSRDVYALLPPGGRHPLVGAALDALREAARSAG